MAQLSALDRFLALLQAAVRDGTLVKLTLGKHRGTDASLKNIFIRPVALKNGQQLSFLYRHATRDITKNLQPKEAIGPYGFKAVVLDSEGNRIALHSM